VKRFTNILRKIPRGGWLTPMHVFLYKLAEANRLIFRLCTLDVPKAREDAAQKLIDAIGMQYDILKDKKASKAQKQRGARLMGYLIQVLSGLFEGVTADQILVKWQKVEQLAEAQYGKTGEGSGEVASTASTS